MYMYVCEGMPTLRVDEGTLSVPVPNVNSSWLEGGRVGVSSRWEWRVGVEGGSGRWVWRVGWRVEGGGWEGGRMMESGGWEVGQGFKAH